MGPGRGSPIRMCCKRGFTHIHIWEVDLQCQDAHMLRPVRTLHQADCLPWARVYANPAGG